MKDQTRSKNIADGEQISNTLSSGTGIIEKKRAEATLQDSEERFRKVFEEGPLGIVLLGLDARIQHCNRRFCEMLAYSEEEIIALGLAGISHPEDWQKDFEVGSRLLNGEIPNYTIEKRYVRKGGVVFWGQLTVSMIHDAEGKPTTVIGMIEDVSERKRAEERLRNSERTLRTLIDASPESIVLLDTNRTVLIANETAAHRLGTTVDEMVGQKSNTFVPAEVAAQRAKHFQEAIRTGKPIRFEDQRSGWYFEIAMHPISDEQGEVVAVAILSMDRTDHKRVERVLRESEERYRKLAESTTDLIAIHDRSGTLLYGNSAGAAYFGIEPGSAVGMTQQEMFSPEMVQKHTECIARVFQTGEIFETDGAYPHDSGEIWINTRLIPLRDENGQVTAVMSVSRNITPRKRAEKALKQAHDELERRVEERTVELTIKNEQLRQSHSELRAIYDGMVDGLLVTDIETQRFMRANAAICRMLGYSETELLSLSVSDIHPAEALSNILDHFPLVADSPATTPGEIPFLRKDGSIFYAEAIGKFLTYDERPCSMGIFRDITERRQAKVDLQQSRDELQAIYDGMIDGLLVANIETNQFVRANSSMCRMLGYSEEQLLSMSVKDIHPPEELASVVEAFRAFAEGRIAVFDDISFLRRDGSVFCAQATGRTIVYNGRPCVIGFFRDITERKHAQDALQREHRTLKHLLQSSDHERQTIAYEIHDGLAQYLAAAIMQFDVYKIHQEKKPNEATKAYDAATTLLSQGHSEARRLIAGIRHPVLDEAGVVEAVAHLINEQNRGKGPQIEFHSHVNFSRLVPLLENAIYRIIQEGLTNACKYSQSRRVRISLLQQKDRLRIEIRDWGIGFNTKDIKEGSYGLTGIRERARLLGGKYRLQSAVGKGTRILVELPLMEREE